MHFMNKRRLLIKAVPVSALLSKLSWAQSFPSRPVKLICPFPPGPTTDAIMRAMAAAAGRILGGTVIVENKSGAGGTLGAVEVAGARPDGYTLTMVPEAFFLMPHMEKVSFDPLRDFTYVICVAGSVYGLVVRADSPIKNVKDLIDYAKANPGKFTYSTAGVGTVNHLAMEEFAERVGIEMLHIPYKGAAPSTTAVLAGEVMASSGQSAWGPHVDRGALRLLATYGTSRTKRWPNVPTLQELGYGVVAESPFGFAGPRGMDPAVTRRLHDAFKASLDDPAVITVLESNSMQSLYMDTAAYTRLAMEKFTQARSLIQRLGLAAKGS